MPIKNSSGNPADNRGEIYAKLNQGILAERLSAFEANVRRNRSLIERHGGLAKVIAPLHDKHVIIAAAGESLGSAFPLLKKIQNMESCVIISVDMAYGALVRNGIYPTFSITCETTPRLFFCGTKSKGATLLAFSCASPTTLRTWKGEIAFYNWMIRDEPYETLWKRAGSGLGYVATGSIVTTQALSLVMGLTPRSVLLCGNDLGFSDLPYARGSVWYDAVYASSTRFTTLPGSARSAVWNAREFQINRGERRYYTNNQFLGAKYWIEDLLAKTGFLLYDMSDPGVSGKYVEKITPGRYERNVLSTARSKRRRR